MFGIVKTINGQKTVIPLTPEARSGNPLGSLICIYSNVVPAGYLPCNGVEFDANQYPALCAMLGDNHTPDLRECTLKMIGESGRTVGAHVKSGGLAVGEFVDDRIMEHTHQTKVFTGGNSNFNDAGLIANLTSAIVTNASTNGVSQSRKGATTEVKAVGVNICIKATSGLEESQQDYVLQAILDAGSYSTTEKATGRRWIDGKMIYSRVLPPFTQTLTDHQWSFAGLPSSIFDNVDHIIKSNSIASYGTPANEQTATIDCHKSLGFYSILPFYAGTIVIVEYTKVTPST